MSYGFIVEPVSRSRFLFMGIRQRPWMIEKKPKHTGFGFFFRPATPRRHTITPGYGCARTRSASALPIEAMASLRCAIEASVWVM